MQLIAVQTFIKSRGEMNMSSAQATVEVFWTAFQALPYEERTLLIKKIINEDTAYEDVVDSLITEERKGEASISIEEYEQDRSNFIEAKRRRDAVNRGEMKTVDGP